METPQSRPEIARQLDAGEASHQFNMLVADYAEPPQRQAAADRIRELREAYGSHRVVVAEPLGVNGVDPEDTDTRGVYLLAEQA